MGVVEFSFYIVQRQYIKYGCNTTVTINTGNELFSMAKRSIGY